MMMMVMMMLWLFVSLEWHSLRLEAWTPSSLSAKRRGVRPESSSRLFVATKTTTTITTTTPTTTAVRQVQHQEIMDPIPTKVSLTVSSSGDPNVAVAVSSRAVQYVSIVWHDFIWPVMLGWWKQPPVLSDWDGFWDMPVDEVITTVATTANVYQNDTTTTTTTTTITAAQQFTVALEHLGPTFVKFGQALSARPDVVPRSLALALSKLQDQMETDDTILDNRRGVSEILRQELWNKKKKKRYNNDDADSKLDEFFATQEDWTAFVDSLSENPVAAASIGVVYSATLPATSNCPTPTKVAIKLQRPGIAKLVQQDARLLYKAAQLLESLPALPVMMSSSSTSSSSSTNHNNKTRRRRLIETDLTGAVNEFMSRIVEELDYHNEVDNIETFANLYSHRRRHIRRSGRATNTKDKNCNGATNIEVVVPQVYKELCTDKVLVMEWIEGTKLADLQRDQDALPHDTLKLVQQGIDCTLSQLLDTGVLHADPHGGNLIKVMNGDNDDDNSQDGVKNSTSVPYRLGYIDFGLLSTIPSTVQDGLVCAVAQLVFARNVSAIADLFGDLQLLPQEIVTDPSERAALANELNEALSMILVYDDDDVDRDLTSQEDSSSTIPTLRFDKLLDVLTRLVPRFQFQLPPYFLNNARALSTLEGMARQADPTFNVLQRLYPYAIQRLLVNPSQSPVVEATLNSLVESPLTGKLNRSKMRRLVEDLSRLSGYSKAKVLRDTLQSPNGSKLTRRFIREQTVRVAGKVVPGGSGLATMTNYMRL